MSKVSKVVFVTVYRVMLLISEVLKVVIAAVYRVVLLMSEVLKVTLLIYYQLHCMNQKIKGYVKGVKRD